MSGFQLQRLGMIDVARLDLPYFLPLGVGPDGPR